MALLTGQHLERVRLFGFYQHLFPRSFANYFLCLLQPVLRIITMRSVALSVVLVAAAAGANAAGEHPVTVFKVCASCISICIRVPRFLECAFTFPLGH